MKSGQHKINNNNPSNDLLSSEKWRTYLFINCVSLRAS